MSEELEGVIREWMKGDHDAFAALYDRFADSLYRYMYFKVGSFDAEDLVELVFLKVWEKRDSYHPKKSSFKTWLFTIARNTVIDFYRSQKETSSLDEAIEIESRESEGPAFVANKQIEGEGIREALLEIDDNYREILVLRYLEDLDYSEIADLLDKTESSVRVLHFRGLKKLKHVLKEQKIIHNL